jgi:hypothetical protein
MRKAARLSLGVLLLLTACTPRWNSFRGGDQRERTDSINQPAPTVEQLVTYLNENSKRLQCVKVEDLEVTPSHGGPGLIALHGKMVCQQPRNFRMTADLTGREVDVGSNQDEFWYWVKRADNVLVHCGYKELQEGKVRKMPFPFQPDWLMEALGMSSFGPPERYQLVEEGQVLKLVERTRSPQGQLVRKVLVLRRRPVLPPAPQVTDFLLLDDQTGKEICSAHVLESQMDRTTGGLLPKRLVLSWPENKLKLTMRLDTVTARVDFPPGFPAFVRPPMQGVRSFDLAAGRFDGQPSSFQRAGYTGR